MTENDNTERLIKQLQLVLDRVETLLPSAKSAPTWEDYTAFRWSAEDGLAGIARPHRLELDDLLCMDRPKAEILRNTTQFMAGHPANNVLLWGSRGTGKSSLVKAVFNRFEPDGLRLIELEKADLMRLPKLLDLLYDRSERFILYCDDLSFDAGEPGFKALKAVLEGSITSPPENVLLYATSNRRHLMAEHMADNLEAHPVGGEIHPGESVEEKISLSERFGLWLSFYPFTQEEYLAIVAHWLARLGHCAEFDESLRAAALRWATHRGSRSGRVARQFALDRLGHL